MMKNKINANFINSNRCYFFLALTLILCALFGKNTFTPYSINAVTGNNSLVMWIGLGFTVCLIAGHMDLSAMYVTTLGSLLAIGLHTETKLPWAVAIILTVLAGVVVGLANGTLATYFKIPSFIVTLGMQFVLRGVMYIMTDLLTGTAGKELSIKKADNAFQAALTDPLVKNVIPFCPYFLITTAVVLLVWLFLRHTRTGRNIYMVGGNLETAWLAGIKSNQVTILAFVISSSACALGGALYGIYAGAASITMGEKGISPLMIALTATIIGGTSIYGGKGSVIWTWVSLLSIAFLKSLFKKTEAQVLVISIILIACIVYETMAQYRRNKVLGTRPNLHLEYLKEKGIQ